MPLKYVEDWLECMYGKMTTDGHQIANGQFMWPKPDTPIKLATYDKRFIDSTVESLARNRGLTDKQVALAIKIITKYKRQWSSLGLDPSYLETEDIPLRLPLREIDRTTSITLEGNILRLRFPYHAKLIAEMHDHRSETYGGWNYDRDGKSWILDLTEGNLRTLISIDEFRSMDWQMDPEVAELIKTAEDCFFEPKNIPTMDLAYGEVIFRYVPEQAMGAFQASRHGDVIMDALIAIKHGITLGPGIKNLYDHNHPINSLLDKTLWDLTHNRYHGVSDITEIMRILPDAEFTMLAHDHKSKMKMIDLFMDMDNEKTFMDSGRDISTMSSLYDTKKNILVLNMNTVTPTDSMNLEDQFLGVLHMNADDEGTWQPVS